MPPAPPVASTPAAPPTSARLQWPGSPPEPLRRRPHRLGPLAARHGATLHFVLLAMEGPDRYSSAGGLGVRVTHLAEALAATGQPTDLYFVGDPALPGVDQRGAVTLHRWCQAISSEHPGGVYDGEERKVEDLCRWWPLHLSEVVAADQAIGLQTVVLAEDWHTAWPLIALHEELGRRQLRHHATLAWTANNRFGFDRIDFPRLGSAARLLTISRAMKHLMWQYGVNPLVVPNGITDDTLARIETPVRDAWRHATAGTVTLTKVGRWDPDKRWPMALVATAQLRDRGERAVLVARGWNGSPGAQDHYHGLRAQAAHHGLDWVRLAEPATDPMALACSVGRACAAGAVVELAFPIAGPTLQGLYAGATAVLANSGFEPFGLVGLEAMGARSVVVTGATGEDYVDPFRNGFALDTDDAGEIVRDLDWLRRDGRRSARIRAAAHETASTYRWANVVERLLLTLDLA